MPDPRHEPTEHPKAESPFRLNAHKSERLNDVPFNPTGTDPL